ncbi:polyketide cyclase [Dietzia sp.]|uniref:polyketide cyclase n=1 Tax=Dietzia sp. TaxID=1871616 RepID=UPI002FDB4C6C
MSERIEVSRTIPATPRELFDLLRDPWGHVAIDSSGMLQSASGEPVSAAGEQFIVHMDRESLGDYDLGKYDVAVRFTNVEPGSETAAAEIAWTIDGAIKPPIGHTYGYRLEPLPEGGTLATSIYDWSTAAEEWKSIFPVISDATLKGTLGILDRTVRHGYYRPAAGETPA